MNSEVRIAVRLLLCLSLLVAPSVWAAEKEDEEVVPASEVAPHVLKHCVRVKVYAKKDEGEAPSVGSMARDLHDERPTLWGGYLWDEKTVVVMDSVLHERFIRRIEVEANGKTVAAKVYGLLVNHRSLFLRLEEPLPGVTPLQFAPPPERDDWGKLRAATYLWAHGRWVVNLTGAVMGFTHVTDENGSIFGHANGLLVDTKGQIVGLTFNGYMSADGNENPWQGQTLRKLPLFTAAEKHKKLETIRTQLRQAALEVKFSFRAEVEEGEDRDWRRHRFGRGNENEAEATATGFLIGPKRLLVPVNLSREMVAKLEAIHVLPPAAPGQRPVKLEATFAGALKDFQAVLVDLKGDPLPGPLTLKKGVEFGWGEVFLKANIDYSLKKRKERLAYDRFRGYFRTYMDIPGVWTFTNEGDGSIAFSRGGEVLAISLAHRPKPTGEEYGYDREANSMFRPVDLILATLAKPDAIDDTIKPLKKEQEKRMVILGVESQRLDVNLAKVFKAEKETRGGEIGLLVIYVYPGTAAAEAGLKPEDILLRVKDPDRAEPIELRAGYGGRNFGFMRSFESMPDEARGAFMNRMPAPWPERENVLTQLLTDIGEGKTVTIEYLRNGQKASFKFTTRKGQPDFRAAAKHKSKKLGFTAKALTYEVKRYYRLEDGGGVVVSRVEPGGKAAVARLHPYLLITHVDKAKVTGLDDFKQKARAFETGEAKSIEFTLWYMGRTRIVKIEM